MLNKNRRETASYFATDGIISKRNSFGIKFNGYRSPYDYKFAKYLEEIDVKFYYEKEGIEVKDEIDTKLHYIPDFYIPSKDLYIEIVNQMTPTLRHKILWFQEQYPQKKLILITKTEVRDFFRGKKDLF